MNSLDHEQQYAMQPLHGASEEFNERSRKQVAQKDIQVIYRITKDALLQQMRDKEQEKATKIHHKRMEDEKDQRKLDLDNQRRKESEDREKADVIKLREANRIDNEKAAKLVSDGKHFTKNLLKANDDLGPLRKDEPTNYTPRTKSPPIPTLLKRMNLQQLEEHKDIEPLESTKIDNKEQFENDKPSRVFEVPESAPDVTPFRSDSPPIPTLQKKMKSKERLAVTRESSEKNMVNSNAASSAQVIERRGKTIEMAKYDVPTPQFEQNATDQTILDQLQAIKNV